MSDYSSPEPTREAVLAALYGVKEPELQKDLVSLNMIKGLKIKEGRVEFAVVPAERGKPLKMRIVKVAREAVEAIPGVSEVEVHVGPDAKTAENGHASALIHLSVGACLAIASGKGGVGKSTIAVNLAVALAEMGARVGLMDADLYGPNIPTMMGVDQLPSSENGKIVPAKAHGVRIISIGLMLPASQPLIWRGPMLHKAIRQLLGDVQWGELDYLIIDLPPGTGDVQITIAQSLSLSGGLIVTLPQKVSLEDARRGLEMFRTMEVPVLGVIENMSYLELPDGSKMDIFGRGGGKSLAEEAQVPFLGEIPMDPQVRQSGDSGLPVVLSHPESDASQALFKIAEILAARLSPETK